MIISASRRTDIPAFYSDWFLKRIEKGYLKTRNPFNPGQVRKVSLLPQDVDCIVFWTKDPQVFLSKLERLRDYPCCFLYTLNNYDRLIEPLNQDHKKRLNIFRKLCDITGPEKVIWRYDPILISSHYTVNYHIENFGETVKYLHTFTGKVIISFVDLYRKTLPAMKKFRLGRPDTAEQKRILESFALIANEYGINLQTCAEEVPDLYRRINQGKCIDNDLISAITGKQTPYIRDKGQRANCLCHQSIDIGAYNTCGHNCVYCYANSSIARSNQNRKKHRIDSEFLID